MPPDGRGRRHKRGVADGPGAGRRCRYWAAALARQSLARLPQHARVLREALECLRDDDRIVGLVLSGSLAHGQPDPWSDVDLYVIPDDDHYAEVFYERALFASQLGRPLAQFTVQGHGGGSSDQIVVYDNLVKLDLMYYRVSELMPHRKWADAVVLKDARGHVRDVQLRSRDLDADSLADETLLRLDQQFWAWSWYTFGKIMRGEQWEALDALHQVRTALLPLLLAHSEHEAEGYRRLESRLPRAGEALAATVPGLDAGSQYRALLAEMALFSTVRESLFSERQLPINRLAEAEIGAAVREEWDTAPHED